MTDSSLPEYPGHELWSLRRPTSLGTGPRRPLGFLDALAARGDFVPFMLARRPAVLLNRPDYVSTVLIGEAAKFHKGSANQRARRLLGNGLLTAAGEVHAERRRLIQPAFARKRLDECAAVVVRRARAMCDRWRVGEVVDVADAIGQLTFGIVGETIVGGLVDAEFRQVQEAVSEAIASLDPLVSLVAPLRRVRRVQSRLRTVVAELASRATEQATEGSLLALLDAHDAQGNGSAGPPSKGSAGLQPCHQPSEQRIDDLLTILVAGHDTITSALSWTLALV
ncbi:MAG: cytochrome P450, partial [Acidobacteria bacterium]